MNKNIHNLWGNKMGGLMIALAILIGLTGCRHDRQRYYHEPVNTSALVEERHPISVTKEHLSISFQVGHNDQALTMRSERDLETFLHYHRDQGTSKIKIKVPQTSVYHLGVENVLRAIRKQMTAFGYGPEQYRVVTGSSNYDRYPSITLSFHREVAHASPCSEQLRRNLAQDERNIRYHTLGCANQNNLAAMVANPRDLKGPRGWSPRDSRYRDFVWDKYLEGRSTDSAKSKDLAVSTSEIGK